MPFEPGQPKVAGSGRKKGTPNKSTTRIAERLADCGADVEKALAEAIINRDIELIKALALIIPYTAAKPRSEEEVKEDLQEQLTRAKSPQERLAIIHGINRQKSSK